MEQRGDEDAFDSVINLEDEYEDEGYLAGVEAGKVVGRIEGREMGCEYGFDLGKDLGFYYGWAKQWLDAAQTHPGLVTERVHKKLEAIGNAVEQVPTVNKEGAEFGDKIKAIQKQFKTMSAMLGINAADELASNSLSF